MTQHAVFIDYFEAARGELLRGDAAKALEMTQIGLAINPDHLGLKLLSARTFFEQGATTQACMILDSIDTDNDTEDATQLRVEVALSDSAVQTARTLVSEAESRAALSGEMAASLKGKIAMADGDGVAARAVLVMAVERFPESVMLRNQLMETLIASGGAGDARAVLSHIAKPPVNPASPSFALEDRPPASA